jgi:hypothetical protein
MGKLKPHYLIDESWHKTTVIIPVNKFEEKKCRLQ